MNRDFQKCGEDHGVSVFRIGAHQEGAGGGGALGQIRVQHAAC